MNHLLILAGAVLIPVAGFFCIILMAVDEWRRNRPPHRRIRRN